MYGAGQIQIELGGKQRSLKFGLGCTKIVCKHHGIKLSEIDKHFGLDDLFTEEVYGGLVHALAVEGKEPEFNHAQVMDWIDQMPQPGLQKVFDAWLQTSQHGETRYEKFIKVIAAANDNEKKKPTGTKLKK